jgi:hypothetical protein
MFPIILRHLEAPELFLFTPIIEGSDQNYNNLGIYCVMDCREEREEEEEEKAVFKGIS